MTKKSILLIEDNADDETLTLRAFRKCGIACQITVARDGAEALEFLSENGGGQADLVLLDLKLPKMNGIQVLERLRSDERTRELPVVVVSTSNYERDISACLALGVRGFLQKPVDCHELAKIIGDSY